MKHKLLYFVVLPALSVAFLSGCGGNNTPTPSSEEEPPKPIEIGDTVKEWCSLEDYEYSPMGVEENGGKIEINEDLGVTDNECLECTLSGEYISSELIEEPFFLEDDAKNGDIISLYFYLPSDHNVASLQIEALTIGNFVTTFYGGSSGESLKGDAVTVNEEKEDKWIRTVVSYDTLETLGAIRLNVVRKDNSKPAHFFVDDINITLGEETVKTGYEYNDESLWQTYEDYFKVGTCMSATMLQNTELRKILRNDFNSVTAENEGKPEQILDQAGCQEAAKKDQTKVVIKTSPFEKLYDFAEAHHIGVRHHTFVWYSQTPAWFFNKNYDSNGERVSRQTMLYRMENYIKVTLETINDRWPGLVYAVDVANEAIENGGLRTNNNNWYSVVGEDFVARAFEYADIYREEGQELYYNDFSFDYNINHCKYAVETLLKEPIENGWIDGVGIQGHIDDDQNMDTVINDAKMIYEKGLKCQITELDLETRGNGDNKWQKQADAYKLLIKRILESNAKEETDINAVIVWGITDNLSWKRGNNPLLFDQDYAKKPAYYAFLEAINDAEI